MNTATQVLRDVIAELTEEHDLHYARLTIDVRDGTVTILGQVSRPAERHAIERAAKRITGIKALALEIQTTAVANIVMGEPIAR